MAQKRVKGMPRKKRTRENQKWSEMSWVRQTLGWH